MDRNQVQLKDRVFLKIEKEIRFVFFKHE
jgi:hypothetical protein